MNIPVWLGWIIVVILTVMTILIFMGKAPFLIAGYNTASKEEKDKYDLKVLSKITGSGLAILTVITALIVYYDANLPSAISWLLPWGILSTLALMLILGNTICKK